MNRDKIIKTNRILNLTIVGLVIVLFAAFALPYFTYSGLSAKEVQSTISMWGYIGFPGNFPQMEVLMDLKFLNIADLNVPLLLIISGVICIITCIMKKGIATMLFPLFFSVYGLVGYFISDFLLWGNEPAYYIHIAILAVTLVVVIANIVLYVMEIKSRPADYYLEVMS